MRVGVSSASARLWPVGERRRRVPGQARELDDAADQRVAVRMRAARGQADQQVAAVLFVQLRQHVAAVHGADAEAGEVEVLARVHARHLGGLAAHQRRASLPAALGDAGHHARGGRHVELAGGEIVQEQQRLGALRQEVVDAHGDQVDPDSVDQPGLDGDHQLGADAVRGRDQQRIVVAGGLQVEQRPEAAQRRIGARPARGLRQRLDRFDERIARVDVDAGLGVGQAVSTVGHGRGLRKREDESGGFSSTETCRVGRSQGYS